ncbi:MAG TPA: phosphoglycerate kinase, partial [Thermoanaerobaculia bacterium]|nr:phosphoglycerate kinase [Thermoanaerobaculia bacterium]
MIRIRTVGQLHLEGARVFYRVDYNVPLDGGKVVDATRIEETLPTLRLLRERDARIVIASHLGRPKGQRNEKYSLKPVRAKLAELIGADVQWTDDCLAADSSHLKSGEMLLLENLRFHPEEEKNDRGFAAQLRKLAEFYVNDAFGASHRAHASIDALPRLFPPDHIAGGLLLANEIEFLQKITNVSARPFVALLGGAKIAGKIEPLEALAKTADTLLIGGGMANTFLAARGVNMGDSLVDNESIDVAKRISKVMLPVDVVLEDGRVVDVNAITGKALDIGPKTIALFESKIKPAKTIFWNGPMGMFEKKEFAKGTMAMARAVAEADATTVVGGGESVEAVNQSGYADRISHISTGGGASLEFISGATLPGIEVLLLGVRSVIRDFLR